MSVYADETFGPVFSVVRLDTYDDALELVNSNPYGNRTAILPTTTAPLGATRTKCRPAWPASTCRSQFRWPTTASAAGRPRSLVTATPTVSAEGHSSPVRRPPRSAGSTRATAVSTSVSPPTGDLGRGTTHRVAQTCTTDRRQSTHWSINSPTVCPPERGPECALHYSSP